MFKYTRAEHLDKVGCYEIYVRVAGKDEDSERVTEITPEQWSTDYFEGDAEELVPVMCVVAKLGYFLGSAVHNIKLTDIEQEMRYDLVPRVSWDTEGKSILEYVSVVYYNESGEAFELELSSEQCGGAHLGQEHP